MDTQEMKNELDATFKSEAWKECVAKCELPVVIGESDDGEVIEDLAKMPHLLIGGATGHGKTVCVRNIIASLLTSRTPEQVRFVLVDIKGCELTPFEDVPHLQVPVITGGREAVYALNGMLMEMERRNKLFEKTNCRDITTFNARLNKASANGYLMPRTLPYVVVVIDEIADIIQNFGAHAKNPITELCTCAQRTGIHLILTTQRADARILPRVMRASIPSRLAFKVFDRESSRNLLMDDAAMGLTRQGELLYRKPDGTLTKAQCPFASDETIEKLTAKIRASLDQA